MANTGVIGGAQRLKRIAKQKSSKPAKNTINSAAKESKLKTMTKKEMAMAAMSAKKPKTKKM